MSGTEQSASAFVQQIMVILLGTIMTGVAGLFAFVIKTKSDLAVIRTELDAYKKQTDIDTEITIQIGKVISQQATIIAQQQKVIDDVVPKISLLERSVAVLQEKIRRVERENGT